MNPFLEACGATGPVLLNIEAPGSPGETRAYDLPFILIGKDPRCDLRLDHPEVSARHAYVQLTGGRLVFADLESRGGVYQGGKRRRLGWLDRDQAVRIGPYRIRLLTGDNDVPPAAAEIGDTLAVSGASGQGQLAFELSHRSVRHSRCEIPEGLAFVGNAAECEVRLIDPSVASYHCALVPTPGGVWVVDLLGQGGIRVNGQEVSYARLAAGDSLQLGHSVVRMVDAGEEPIKTLADLDKPVVLAPISLRFEQLQSPPAPHSRVPVPEPVLHSASSWAGQLLIDPSESDFEVEHEHSLINNGSSRWPEGNRHHDDSFVFGNKSATVAPGDRNGMIKGSAKASELALPVSQTVEIVERILAPMLGQVGTMQQQMVDELHQARASMFEMFSTLQQQQSAALDDELEQLRRVSQDLNLFRADLERQARTLSELSVRISAAAPQPASNFKPMIPFDASERTAVTLAAPTLVAQPQASISIPIPRAERPMRALPVWDREDESPSLPVTSSLRITSSSPINVAENKDNCETNHDLSSGPEWITSVPTRRERQGPLNIPVFPVPRMSTKVLNDASPDSLPGRPTIRVHDENVHNQLCERIVQIREEHRGRWKRLLAIIPGVGIGRTAP